VLNITERAREFGNVGNALFALLFSSIVVSVLNRLQSATFAAMTSDQGVENPLLSPLLFLYQLLQWVISKTLSPSPPRSKSELSRPKIAIIGAGITGVTAAAHCVGHGFDVVIFEGGSEEQVGGIWSVSCSQADSNPPV
jgi:hypothetical protein